MNNTAKSVYTLFNWNILILPTDEEIFVGLCNRPETVPPFAPPDAADDLLPFILQNSSAISEFNDKTGVGMIRFSVWQMMKPDEIRWKYEFID